MMRLFYTSLSGHDNMFVNVLLTAQEKADQYNDATLLIYQMDYDNCTWERSIIIMYRVANK